MEVADNVEKLVSMYAPLFDGGLGTIKGSDTHLKLNRSATPQFLSLGLFLLL